MANGTVYLLHFNEPYPHGRRPQHYLGHADEGRLEVRLREHAHGSNKAALTRALAVAGIGFVVARTWEGDYELEKELKRRHRPASLCSVCTRVRAAAADRGRTACTSCGKKAEWYELKPGDGRCNDCAP